MVDDKYRYTGYPHGLKYPWIYPRVSEKERDRRWKMLRSSIQKHDLDCLIIPADSGNFLWRSGYASYVSNQITVMYNSFVIFPLEGESTLLVGTGNGPQTIHTATEVSWITDIRGSLNQTKDIIDRLRELRLEKGRLGIVGYEEMQFPASVFDRLRAELTNAHFTPATDVMLEIMDISSEEELAMVKKCARLCDLSFESVAKIARPGLKEYDLWAAAGSAILGNGGVYPHFMIATSARRPIFPRLPPSHSILREGDVIIFELNADYAGCSTQICFAIALGPPEEEIANMFELCTGLYDSAIEQLESQKKTYSEIERGLVEHVHRRGYKPMTPQIHRFGMSIRLPKDRKPRPGDYFTVHPNIVNQNYTAGAKFGDTVLIGKDRKVRYLMKTPRKLNIV